MAGFSFFSSRSSYLRGFKFEIIILTLCLAAGHRSPRFRWIRKNMQKGTKRTKSKGKRPRFFVWFRAFYGCLDFEIETPQGDSC